MPDRVRPPAGVAALLAEYAHVVDGGRYEDWPGLFAEECLYRITTRENHERGFPIGIVFCDSRGMLRDRVVSIRTANAYEPHRYRHLVSCTRLEDAEARRWRLSSNYMVTRIMENGAMTVFSTGEYRDVVVRQDGRYLFEQRLVICDHSVIDNLIALPL